MADRVSVSIAIGGAITAAAYEQLAEVIADEGLSLEWDGPPFAPQERVAGEPLRLCAHEVAWGRLDTLETFCIDHGLAFARWSGGYPGQFGPERAVFAGTGELRCYGADEEDYVVIGRHTAEALGSYDAIIANFDEADFAVPPLVVDAGETDNG